MAGDGRRNDSREEDEAVGLQTQRCACDHQKKTKQKQHCSNRLPFNYTQAEVTPAGCSTLTSVQSNRSGAGHTESVAQPSTAMKSSGHIMACLSFYHLHLYNVPDLTNDIYFAIVSPSVLRPGGEDLLLSLVPQLFCEDA